MQFLYIALAIFACFASGAVYYMALQKPWLKAIGKTQEEVQNGSAQPYIISLIAQTIAIIFMRYLFIRAGVDTAGAGLMMGASLGAFIAGAWIFINNGYEGKPIILSIINAGYSTIGLAFAGLVLGWAL